MYTNSTYRYIQQRGRHIDRQTYCYVIDADGHLQTTLDGQMDRQMRNLTEFIYSRTVFEYSFKVPTFCLSVEYY